MEGRDLVRVGSTALFAAVAMVALVLAAPAMAAKKFPRAEFKVEIDGTQFSDWTYSASIQSFCPGGGQTNQNGSGREDFSLTTKKPVKVVATWIKGNGANSVFFSRPNGTAGVPVNVAAIREGNIQTTQTGGTGEGCGDGGPGGTPPPQPDCGERSFNAEVRMKHLSPDQFFGDPAPLNDVLTLDGPLDPDGNPSMSDQWQNCPGGPSGGRYDDNANGALKKKQIFGKDKKFTVKGKDTTPHTGSYGGQTVSKWKVVFKRLKKD